MRKLNYRLIVSDYDKTLTNDDNRVPEKVKNAINEYVESSGIFAVCTGRMPNSILPQARALGLKGLVVAYQGTEILEIESGKIIKNGAIPYSDVARICREIEDAGECVTAYSNEDLYTDIPKDNKYLISYEEIIGVEAVSVNGKLSDYILENRIDCQKAAGLVAAKNRDKLYKRLVEKLGQEFDVTCSASSLVEVSPKEDNKGEALKFLAAYFNIPMDLTVGIGDNLNDLPLIKTAGVGVAVANAEPELKAAADYVSISNNDGAVADVIDKYGFA